MADDDDDSDEEKSSMSSTMSTAGGKKGKAAAGGGSGLGLCLCLVGVLGVCAAGAVAAFMLLDEGGGANKTGNASEASAGASGSASSASTAATPPTEPAAEAKPARLAYEDAPRLDAYGRFAPEEDKPLKAAVVARQRVRRKSHRRRSRISSANAAVAKQYGQRRENPSKHKTATRRHTRASSRQLPNAVKSTAKSHGNRAPRRHPLNASHAGAAAHRSVSLRTYDVKTSTEAISDKVSVTSVISRKNSTAMRHVATRRVATRSTDSGGMDNTVRTLVGSERVPAVPAGGRLNVSAGARVVESTSATQTASATGQITGSLKRNGLGGTNTSVAGAVRTELPLGGSRKSMITGSLKRNGSMALGGTNTSVAGAVRTELPLGDSRKSMITGSLKQNIRIGLGGTNTSVAGAVRTELPLGDSRKSMITGSLKRNGSIGLGGTNTSVAGAVRTELPLGDSSVPQVL